MDDVLHGVEADSKPAIAAVARSFVASRLEREVLARAFELLWPATSRVQQVVDRQASGRGGWSGLTNTLRKGA